MLLICANFTCQQVCVPSVNSCTVLCCQGLLKGRVLRDVQYEDISKLHVPDT